MYKNLIRAAMQTVPDIEHIRHPAIIVSHASEKEGVNDVFLHDFSDGSRIEVDPTVVFTQDEFYFFFPTIRKRLFSLVLYIMKARI